MSLTHKEWMALIIVSMSRASAVELKTYIGKKPFLVGDYSEIKGYMYARQRTRNDSYNRRR